MVRLLPHILSDANENDRDRIVSRIPLPLRTSPFRRYLRTYISLLWVGALVE
jgi:hypothetical protein